jgi:hypothetical protein
MSAGWKIVLLVAPLVASNIASGFARQQPIQFPHKTHLTLGLDCVDCHTGADTRAAAGIPSVAQCMLCHQKLATEKPEVKKIREYASTVLSRTRWSGSATLRMRALRSVATGVTGI